MYCLTAFLRENKRSPNIKDDGWETWLTDQIESLNHLKNLFDLSPFGEGALSAYKHVLKEMQKS